MLLWNVQRNMITILQDRVGCTRKKGSNYLATLTILGLYCLRSCNKVFIVFPVSIISFKHSMWKAHISGLGIENCVLCWEENIGTYLHNQDILCKKKRIIVLLKNSELDTFDLSMELNSKGKWHDCNAQLSVAFHHIVAQETIIASVKSS